ncbi:hypothetical protein NDU88_000939 [Pleurodeles waltl]|uniref:Uncharacterized protein n=1 Tax=Pleurodeles waltl TaxID=8319 RepID=A0AAV7V6T2_PLEWA|nr:hypothetical protein NDU88_000939 [Pleurodeles waltl]
METQGRLPALLYLRMVEQAETWSALPVCPSERDTCDGSDRSDQHAIVPSAVSAGGDPEVTERATLPNGSTWCPRDERAVKGEVLERQEEIVGSGNLQEAAVEQTRRNKKTKEERSLRSSGVPGERTRLEPRALTVSTWDEDRQPREAYA